jgi:hypothetical protein
MTSLTRGPLSPGVYWRRRVFVLGLATALVVLIAGLLRGGSDGSSGADPDAVAEQAAATPTSTPSEEQTRSPGRKKKRDKATQTPTQTPSPSPSPSPPPLPAPTGDCVDSDVLVKPVVEQAIADRDVKIGLELRTRTTAACNWQVSPSRLTLKITSGSDDIWASRHCPRVVPTQDVVVRQATTATVDVVWADARRSAPDCTRAGWALPGYYHVNAAVLGGEPAGVQFELVAPSPEVITESPKPDKGKNKGKNKNNPDRSGREN